MQIQITARHLELPPAARAFAEERLGRLQRLNAGIPSIHLIVTAERAGHTAELTLRAHHHDVVITEWSEHVRTAIEQAADRLEEQLRRLKEKRIDTRQRHEGGRGLNAQFADTPAGDEEEA